MDILTTPPRPNKTLIVSGACFHFNSGGIFNSIEDIHTHDMWDCIRTSHPRHTANNKCCASVMLPVNSISGSEHG